MIKIHSSEITPEHVYLSRRKFLVAMGLGASHALLSACGRAFPTVPIASTAEHTPAAEGETPAVQGDTDELGLPVTSFEAITNYNNFYEFSLRKEDVARLSEDFEPSPWKVWVSGMVNTPRVFDLDDLRAFEEEERIYRMRCVEAWSMVIPWLGFPLARLLEAVEPTSEAKYVRFETLYDPERMPGQNSSSFPWPYVEGLRLDEAMHDLTLLSTGLYGKPLLPQCGAPVRLVVPWKYGFKSIKSIVKIELVDQIPTSMWMGINPAEYGFWANVNPEVSHPRWSQATERVIGLGKRRETLFFNGYAEEVADLYPNLDKRSWYY